MKTLRSKIFVFICLLLLFPAVPLSVFIMQLLDKSYRIGVNQRVESALDGALQISSDFYQMNKLRIQEFVDDIQTKQIIQHDLIKKEIEARIPEVKYSFLAIKDIEEALVSEKTINKFLQDGHPLEIWPNAEHSRLFALARLNENEILALEYPLPESFRSAAKSIQEVNQIYKTLGFVQSDIRRSFLFTFLTIYLFGVILALVVSYFISKKITKPINQLVIATNEVGKGDLTYRIPVKGTDEFSVLGNAFNQMIQALAENQKRIIELEKMATWQQLARKLAHEIKNPLTPIQLMAQQMRDKYDGKNTEYEAMLSECCTIIEDEVGSLQRLVREFSDFARLPEFRLIKQDIVPLLKSIERLYGHLNINIVTPEDSVELNIDHDYMKRVFINLIDNAIASGETDNKIEIRLEKAVDNYIQIVVEDNGEGISEENIQKVFEPYFSTKRSGVGLGLPIVKKVIKEHGGEIEVKSKVGEGTTFFISLPCDS